jgi:hypothetical protein
MKNNLGCFIYLMLFVVLLLYIGYVTLRNIILEKNGVHTNGIVYNRTQGHRSISSHYSFVVNGQKYFGKSTYQRDVKYLTKRWKKRENVFVIGDTIDVIYDRTNPLNNKSGNPLYSNDVSISYVYLFSIIPIIAVCIYCYWRYVWKRPK